MSARDENAPEPVELIMQPGAVLRVGRTMLTSGTGSYPVKTAMDQVVRVFGLDQHEAHVTPHGDHRDFLPRLHPSGQRSPRFTRWA